MATSQLVPAQDYEHGYRIEHCRTSLLRSEPGSPTAGLSQIAWYCASAAGFSPELNRVFRPLGLLSPPQVIGRRDDHVLELIRANSHGQIRYSRDGIDLAWLGAQIVLAFPNATIAFVGASGRRVRRFHRRLRQWVPTATLITDRHRPGEVGRVVVGTYGNMGHVPVGWNWRRIVIALDAEEAAAEYAQMALLAAWGARLFAFSPLDRRPAPRNWDRIVATFGLEQVTVPQHGFQCRSVRVATLGIRGGPQLQHKTTNWQLRSNGIWRHRVRNRRISAIATALVAADRQTLQNLCPMCVPAAATPVRTLLVTDAVDHALEFAAHLPGWPLVTAGGVIVDGLTALQRAFLAGRGAAAWDGTRAIVTTTALASMNLDAVDAIVWAGGGRHLAPLPADKLISPARQDRPLLLVDCDDRHHPQLRRWSRLRRDAYEDAGWFPVGVDPLIGRIQHFLSQRPRR
ncbi:MAG TPA: hypothetical protein VHV55_28465 [Pirellulales bacterium]|nr:hypothetical protein [Pirellulales bacterium]